MSLVKPHPMVEVKELAARYSDRLRANDPRFSRMVQVILEDEGIRIWNNAFALIAELGELGTWLMVFPEHEDPMCFDMEGVLRCSSYAEDPMEIVDREYLQTGHSEERERENVLTGWEPPPPEEQVSLTQKELNLIAITLMRFQMEMQLADNRQGVREVSLIQKKIWAAQRCTICERTEAEGCEGPLAHVKGQKK